MKKGRRQSAEFAARKGVEEARQAARHEQTVRVNLALLRPDSSYGIPAFVERGSYKDAAFICKDCGVEEIWRATQQKWWYETAKGSVWTTAVRCRLCRRKERERGAKARATHLAGVAAKRNNEA